MYLYRLQSKSKLIVANNLLNKTYNTSCVDITLTNGLDYNLYLINETFTTGNEYLLI